MLAKRPAFGLLVAVWAALLASCADGPECEEGGVMECQGGNVWECVSDCGYLDCVVSKPHWELFENCVEQGLVCRDKEEDDYYAECGPPKTPEGGIDS